MVVISFSIFKEKIINGTKTQTIRPYSEKRWKSILKNRKLQLYWKLRTKETKLLREVELKDLFLIRFHCYFDELGHECETILKKEGDGWRELSSSEQTELALRDGFSGLWDLFDWFEKRYGNLCGKEFMVIRW